jgi:hypothetical protein
MAGLFWVRGVASRYSGGARPDVPTALSRDVCVILVRRSGYRLLLTAAAGHALNGNALARQGEGKIRPCRFRWCLRQPLSRGRHGFVLPIQAGLAGRFQHILAGLTLALDLQGMACIGKTCVVADVIVKAALTAQTGSRSMAGGGHRVAWQLVVGELCREWRGM